MLSLYAESNFDLLSLPIKHCQVLASVSVRQPRLSGMEGQKLDLLHYLKLSVHE